MTGIMASVDQRTKLVGENRLEILMFKLAGRQKFAINVFKVQEVLNLPNLTQMPHRHPFVCGVTHFRGQTVPVINLSQAIDKMRERYGDRSVMSASGMEAKSISRWNPFNGEPPPLLANRRR